MQLAAAHHLKNTFFVGFLDAQGHVVLQLFLQAVPDLPAGDVLALAPRQRRGVHAEVHGQRRLVHLEHGQRRRVERVGDGHANADVRQAIDQHDFTRTSFQRLHALQALERQHLVDAALDRAAIRAFHHHDIHRGTDGAGADAAHANATDKGREIKCRDLQLQRRCRVTFLCRHVAQHGVEQR